jgi:crossover junction endonuclease MUS81
MKACPLEFQHPSQAQQLNGLGPKLCDRLTDKLKIYCDENGLPMPEPPDKGKSPFEAYAYQNLAHQIQ